MNNHIEHSAKGTHWTKKRHKYLSKINGRYIYPTEYSNRQKERHYDRQVQNVKKKYKIDDPDTVFKMDDNQWLNYNQEVMKPTLKWTKAHSYANAAREVDARRDLENKNFNKKYLVTKHDTDGERTYKNTTSMRQKADPWYIRNEFQNLIRDVRNLDTKHLYKQSPKSSSFSERSINATARAMSRLAKKENKKFIKDSKDVNGNQVFFRKAESRGKKAVKNILRRLKQQLRK